jgi:replicative DNA helicase
MKVEHFDGRNERKILTAMIVNKIVLSRIASKWTNDLFRSKYANKVGGWCVSHYNKYKTAPRKDIITLYENWAEQNQKDPDTIKLIGTFLKGLSDDYKQLNREINPELVIDTAQEYFSRIKAERIIEEVQKHQASGQVSKIIDLLPKSKVEMGVNAGLNLFADIDKMIQMVGGDDDGEDSNILIHYPGAAGEFFQSFLCRDSFIGILAPEKRGKTFHLMDIAFRGMMEGHRVAFFEVGDMSAQPVHRRFCSRMMNRPSHSSTGLWPLTYRMPTSISFDKESDMAIAELEEKVVKRKPPDEKIRSAMEEMTTKFNFKISFHPNRSVSVDGIRGALDSYKEIDNWDADIIVIDYADILAPLPRSNRFDLRDQINETWMSLRGLAQERHALVVTATQARRGAYAKKILEMEDVSDDKRKLGHAHGIMGLNQTREERNGQIMRWNWPCVREGENDQYRCVHVAQCLAVANPCVVSTWGEQ